MDAGSRLFSWHAPLTTALLGAAALLWFALALLAVLAALGLGLVPTPDSHLLLSPTRWPTPNGALA